MVIRSHVLGALLCLLPLVTACEKEPPPTATQKPKAKSTATASAPSPGAPALPQPPKSLGKPREGKDNPTTPEKVELGRQLYFDKRLSSDGSLACYSCHQNEDGTGGHLPVAVGAGGKTLTRHPPTMWNVAYLPRLYWDGRADSLEALSKGALTGGNMGIGADNLDAKAAEIGAIAGYKKQFDDIFPAEGVTADTLIKALAAYQRTLFCGKTVWDRFDGGDPSALNDEQKAGWSLFTGKAACNQCHVPPFFSDAYTIEQGAYHNVGIGIEGKAKADVDPGRGKISENPSEWATFKTPSLRNISKSPPYFHNGSVAKLEDAVRFMAGGGFANENRDTRLADRKLSDQEIAQLVAFLGSLECEGKLEQPASLP